MAKRIWQLVPMVMISFFTGAQSKVVTHSSGKGGTQQYENFSFWIKDKRQADIMYSYGTNREEMAFSYPGKTTFTNQPECKVQFANRYAIYSHRKESNRWFPMPRADTTKHSIGSMKNL